MHLQICGEEEKGKNIRVRSLVLLGVTWLCDAMDARHAHE
jgi:hypothetical protein